METYEERDAREVFWVFYVWFYYANLEPTANLQAMSSPHLVLKVQSIKLKKDWKLDWTELIKNWTSGYSYRNFGS
jgi:hypothetical protein